MRTADGTGLAYRLVRSACSERDRRWVDALYAETQAIDGRWTRIGWLLGASEVVLRSNLDRLRRLPADRMVLTALAFCIAVAAFASYWLGVELNGLDDDYMGISGLVASLVLVEILRRVLARSSRTGVNASRGIFTDPERR